MRKLVSGTSVMSMTRLADVFFTDVKTISRWSKDYKLNKGVPDDGKGVSEDLQEEKELTS